MAWYGTSSLSKQLKPATSFHAIAPGDKLIKGGFPGHAVIVLDMAENKEGKNIFLLVQSYACTGHTYTEPSIAYSS